ncbi:MAG TPA: hypothetical protein PKD54_11335 [Pirellulaceae bacterium]|nr:hypothetical protein [Pirellulaceae bacterium]
MFGEFKYGFVRASAWFAIGGICGVCTIAGCSSHSDGTSEIAKLRARAEAVEDTLAEVQQAHRHTEDELAKANSALETSSQALAMKEVELQAMQQENAKLMERLVETEQSLAIFEQRLGQIPDLVRELQVSLAKLQSLNAATDGDESKDHSTPPAESTGSDAERGGKDDLDELPLP